MRRPGVRRRGELPPAALLLALSAAACGRGEPAVDRQPVGDPATAAEAVGTGGGDALPAAVAEAADPAPAGDGWTLLHRLPDPTGEIALLLDGDAGAHAAWIGATAEGRVLVHATLSTTGAERVDTLLRGWAALDTPRLLAGADGVLVLFAGDSAAAGRPVRLYATRAGTGGLPGPPGVVSAAQDRIGPITTVLDREGSPVIAWPTAQESRLAFGLEPLRPPTPVPGCCGHGLALARDADGSIVLAGAVDGAGGRPPGLETMSILPADDASFEVPSSSPAAGSGGEGGFAATGLHRAPGVFVIYCGGAERCEAMRVWRHGATPGEAPAILARTATVRLVAAAPTRDDRLWAAWVGEDSVHAVRTRARGDVSSPGPVIPFPLPRSVVDPVALALAAQEGALDLVLAGREPDGLTLWRRRVLPALSVTPPAMPPPLDQDAVLQLAVDDAGDPVAGALVRALGHTMTTDARGVVGLPMPAGLRTDTLEVAVEAQGYAPLHVTFHGSRPEGRLP